MKSKDLVKEIIKDGWYEVSVRGSHHYYKHPTKPGKVTIPHPKSQLQKGLVQAIRKQARL